MDPLYESLLNKIWVPMQNWNQPPYTVQQLIQLTDEVYKYYHGEDQAAPPSTITDSAYNAGVTEMIQKMGQSYFQLGHDHSFDNPKSTASSADEWRVYLHAKAKDVRPIGLYIINILFPRFPEVSGFKVPRSGTEADHFSDTIVIYAGSQTACEQISTVIQQSPLISALLTNQSVPEWTRRTLDGVSYGQSPKDFNVSFGKIRSAAIAKGIELYWKQGGTDPNDMITSRAFLSHCVEIAIRAIGLDPNNAHKNDGAQPKKTDLNRFYQKEL